MQQYLAWRLLSFTTDALKLPEPILRKVIPASTDHTLNILFRHHFVKLRNDRRTVLRHGSFSRMMSSWSSIIHPPCLTDGEGKQVMKVKLMLGSWAQKIRMIDWEQNKAFDRRRWVWSVWSCWTFFLNLLFININSHPYTFSLAKRWLTFSDAIAAVFWSAVLEKCLCWLSFLTSVQATVLAWMTLFGGYCSGASVFPLFFFF